MTSTNGNPIRWTDPWKETKSARKVLRLAGILSQQYRLIEPGDHILVACSGGKDSSVLAWTLQRIQKRVPFSFDFTCLNIDQGFGGYRQDIVGNFLKQQNLDVALVKENVGDICRVKIGADGNPCWLCARMRRGILYSQAKRLKCNKLALGHHADDTIETLLMNQFFSGCLKAMPPRLRTQDGELVVIRPLLHVLEDTIRTLAGELRIPIVGCDCDFVNNQASSERALAKQLLCQLEQRIPDVKTNLLASLARIEVSHLMDLRLFGFDD